MDRILIAGLREMGVHGVLAEEQERAQPFQVDLELLVDVANAGSSDALSDTVDYGVICDAVRRVVADEHHQLLERLATRISRGVPIRFPRQGRCRGGAQAPAADRG